jgi:hypothetical protein
MCSLRLRFLYSTKECSLCKLTLDQVIFTTSRQRRFEDMELSKMTWKYEKLGIFCEDPHILEQVDTLCKIQCPHESCKSPTLFQLSLGNFKGRWFDHLRDVTKHVMDVHQLVLW